MIIIDKYIYTCHRNIVNSKYNKKSYSAPHASHIYKTLYKIRRQINIKYYYYTNTYVEIISTIIIKICANGPR